MEKCSIIRGANWNGNFSRLLWNIHTKTIEQARTRTSTAQRWQNKKEKNKKREIEKHRNHSSFSIFVCASEVYASGTCGEIVLFTSDIFKKKKEKLFECIWNSRPTHPSSRSPALTFPFPSIYLHASCAWNIIIRTNSTTCIFRPAQKRVVLKYWGHSINETDQFKSITIIITVAR